MPESEKNRISVDLPGPELGIGLRLKEAREKLKLSASEVAREAGIHRATLKHYETGARFPGAKELRRLCDVLRVSADYLLYGEQYDLPDGMQPLEITGWIDRLDEITDAFVGFGYLPAGQQMAFIHLIKSASRQYVDPAELENARKGAEVARPFLEAFASGDKDRFMQAIRSLPKPQPAEGLDSTGEDSASG